jgi:hypothetical protein
VLTSNPEQQRGWPARHGAAPSAESLLQAWEDGRDTSPGERGLTLLRVAALELPEDVRADLTVGQRDARLLDLFRHLFGDTAPALSTCPGCAEQIEFDVPLNDISIPTPADQPGHDILVYNNQTINYRLPRAGDLAALGLQLRNDSVDVAARSLIQRCVLTIRDRNGTPSAADLTPETTAALEAAISERVAKADPQAVITLTFDCPSCAAHWQAPFDIVEFLWRRLDVFARGLLRDVHVLASNYGWTEREIVSLSPSRRRYYFELIGS